ncbi:hypothetical protein [Bradyrhizobium sp. RDM4]|uniref:hypothetical protein n=1 Tax=Bradyrhizobium sp. RDM4 TaxID=3378765 RepID=UPI0038FC839A
MASKFWVGGGTNASWNSSPVTNWANSSGGAGNQTAPVAGDSVFFDGNSGTGVLSLNVSISLATLDCTGSKNQIQHGSSITITISSGNLILPTGVGGTYTHLGFTSVFAMTGTSGTQQLKTNGNALGSLTINGVGGTTQLQDALTATTANAVLTLTNGTFDAQGFAVSLFSFSSSNSNTRVLKGSGAWTISGTGGTPWNTLTPTALDLSNFSASITISGTPIAATTFAFGSLTYSGGLTINANTSIFHRVISGSNTFGSLSINGPQVLSLPASFTQTISAAFTINGGAGSEIYMFSSTIALASIISCVSGACSFSWAAFHDITFSGGASFTANNSFDLGHNTGITITPPQAAGPIARNMVFDRGSPY